MSPWETLAFAGAICLGCLVIFIVATSYIRSTFND